MNPQKTRSFQKLFKINNWKLKKNLKYFTKKLLKLSKTFLLYCICIFVCIVLCYYSYYYYFLSVTHRILTRAKYLNQNFNFYCKTFKTKRFKTRFLNFNFSYLAFLDFPILSDLLFFSILSGSLTRVHQQMMKIMERSVCRWTTQ